MWNVCSLPSRLSCKSKGVGVNTPIPMLSDVLSSQAWVLVLLQWRFMMSSAQAPCLLLFLILFWGQVGGRVIFAYDILFCCLAAGVCGDVGFRHLL